MQARALLDLVQTRARIPDVPYKVGKKRGAYAMKRKRLWMGPPQGKRAPKVGLIRTVIRAREGSFTDWKQCHGSHGFHGADSRGTVLRLADGSEVDRLGVR